ncbi:MAG: uroporphyrinogen decarboxylase family protein [Candidatus Omnitrophica bacterium]|nr:uroporphyrinogen decarboxylase family protein [Candidatus Omnitrophota bacterium]
MTGKEKINCAFSKQGTDEFAVVICYEGIFVRDHWSLLTKYPWYTVHLPDIESQVSCYSEIQSKIPQDWFVVHSFYSYAERKNIKVKFLQDRIQIIDKETNSTREVSKPVVAGWSVSGRVQSIKIEKLPETISDMEKLLGEKPEKFSREDFLSQGKHELAQSLIKRFPDRMPICHVGSPLWCIYGMLGFEGLMTLLKLNPEIIKYCCERFLENGINAVEQHVACGAELIWIEECLTDMISPSAFESINVPYMKKLVAAIRDLGAKSIYYYCGNPWDRLDKIFDIGADALALEEGKKNFEIDIEKIVDTTNGRFVVFGNLDAINILPYADTETLKNQIKRQINAGKRNKRRFVMSIGSPVTPETGIERVQLYFEIARKLGS